MKIFNIKQQALEIGNYLDKGGEAEIYLIKTPNFQDLVFKKYNEKTLQKRGQETLDKINAMQEIVELRQHPYLSWPRTKCYDDKKQWIGYTMNKVKGKSFVNLINYKTGFPELNRLKLVSYLLNYVKLVDKLHKNNIRIGDYNMKNIFFDPTSDKVYLIDCDSFQINTPNGKFYCPVGTPDIIPKEHQGKDFLKDKIVRTLASERFSIAVILFKALNGKHPYDHIGGITPEQNIRSGIFPYLLNGQSHPKTPKGPWYEIWKNFPYEIKKRFIQAFVDGADHPNKRPTLQQWIYALNVYKTGLENGTYSTDMRPSN